MPTAFSYSRFSSVTQKRGSSLERQQSMVSEWIVRHPEYSISELTFQDLGKSGWRGEHIKEGGGFADLLAAVTAGVIQEGDAVLVESVDRAGRLDTLDMLTRVISPILRAGVSIITLDDNVIYTRQSLDGGPIYILLGKIQAARQYSDNLSRRLKGSYDSRRRLANEGKTPKRNTPAWLTSKGEVIPEVAAQVKLAFELYASGLGKAVIAKRMRESGVEALAKCSGPGVEGWLRNEAAIGRWNGAQVYEPVIDISLYHLAQLEGQRRKTSKKIKTAAHFYVGLIKCGCCSHNFIMRTIKGVQVSMRCRKRQELNGCDNKKVIPREIIDTVYLRTSAEAALRAVERNHAGVNEQAISAAEVKLLEISKTLENYSSAIKTVGPIPELLGQLMHADDARKVAERELAMLKATVVHDAGRGWQMQGVVWGLERDDPQRLSAMLRSVGYSITIHSDGRLVSDSGVTFRYAGVDRKLNRYKLMRGNDLILVLKGPDEDYPYWEPFEEIAGSATWDDADYENLRLQYE